MSETLKGVPKRFQNFRYAVTRERTARRVLPMGQYPAYAAVCLKAGAAVSDVLKPLEEVRGWILSHAEQTRCIATALFNATKEQGEANTAGLKLMRQADRPSNAALDEYIREATEARDELSAAIDCAYALRWGAK